MDKAKISELLINAGLGEYKEAILEFAKPCIRLHASLAESPDTIPIGASHIGGLPDLPPDVGWPVRNGRPCEFIAQINLKDVAAFDEQQLLPREGVLLFFFDGGFYQDADISLYQSGRETIIFYDGDLSLLERAADFPVLLDPFQHYKLCVIQFERDWMLPNSWNTVFRTLEDRVFQFTERRNRDVMPYRDTMPSSLDNYRQLTDDCIPKDDSDKHHLFGYAEPVIQDDPAYSFPNDEGEEAETLGNDWVLLLQISCDYDVTGMLWGDTSSLYYSIRKQDLIARRFENAICELQFS